MKYLKLTTLILTILINTGCSNNFTVGGSQLVGGVDSLNCGKYAATYSVRTAKPNLKQSPGRDNKQWWNNEISQYLRANGLSGNIRHGSDARISKGNILRIDVGYMFHYIYIIDVQNGWVRYYDSLGLLNRIKVRRISYIRMITHDSIGQ